MVAPTPKEQADHDALVALVVTVNFLKESQEKFHQEMKGSMADLKGNYAIRLDRVESSISNVEKVFIAKEVQDRMNNMFLKRIGWLEKFVYMVLGAWTLLLTILEFYFRFIKP